MKIVSLPRGTGKTTAAIVQSALTGKYIVVMNKQQARMIADMAMELKLNIPFPVTIAETTENKSPFIKEVIVDEAGIMLEQLLNKKISMMTVTDDEK